MASLLILNAHLCFTLQVQRPTWPSFTFSLKAHMAQLTSDRLPGAPPTALVGFGRQDWVHKLPSHRECFFRSRGL
eukprot:jgi/Botrbrau1/3894/Bobra.0183s0115.1